MLTIETDWPLDLPASTRTLIGVGWRQFRFVLGGRFDGGLSAVVFRFRQVLRWDLPEETAISFYLVTLFRHCAVASESGSLSDSAVRPFLSEVDRLDSNVVSTTETLQGTSGLVTLPFLS